MNPLRSGDSATEELCVTPPMSWPTADVRASETPWAMPETPWARADARVNEAFWAIPVIPCWMAGASEREASMLSEMLITALRIGETVIDALSEMLARPSLSVDTMLSGAPSVMPAISWPTTETRVTDTL
jgi:hypothetical protein